MLHRTALHWKLRYTKRVSIYPGIGGAFEDETDKPEGLPKPSLALAK